MSISSKNGASWLVSIPVHYNISNTITFMKKRALHYYFFCTCEGDGFCFEKNVTIPTSATV